MIDEISARGCAYFDKNEFRINQRIPIKTKPFFRFLIDTQHKMKNFRIGKVRKQKRKQMKGFHYISVLMFYTTLSIGCGKRSAHSLETANIDVQMRASYDKPVLQTGEEAILEAKVESSLPAAALEVAWFHKNKVICPWTQPSPQGISKCEFEAQADLKEMIIEARVQKQKQQRAGIYLELVVHHDLQAQEE